MKIEIKEIKFPLYPTTAAEFGESGLWRVDVQGGTMDLWFVDMSSNITMMIAPWIQVMPMITPSADEGEAEIDTEGMVSEQTLLRVIAMTVNKEKLMDL